MSRISSAGGGGLSLDGYSDETSAKSFSTEYQNTADGPLLVQITDDDSSYGGAPKLLVGDTSGSLATITEQSTENASTQSATAIVPVGYYYQADGRNDVYKTWFEMVLK